MRDKQDQQPPSKRQLTKFIETLNNTYQSEEVEKDNKPPVILPLLNKLCESPKSHKKSQPIADDVSCESTSLLEQKLTQGIIDHPEYIHTPESLVSKLVYTKDEITHVNELTLKQWRCKEWYFQKAGFITASMCKRVYTRQETVEKNEDNSINVDNLVTNIVQPKSDFFQSGTAQTPQGSAY